MTRKLALAATILALSALACSGAGGQDQSPTALIEGPPCDEVAIAVQERVDEARVVLGERTPMIADDLEETIKHLTKEERGRANASYARVKRGIEDITRSSNRLLDRLSETVTECDGSVAPACWPDVTAAYEAAGGTAIAILQGPLRTMLERVEAFFTLGRDATMKETTSSYMELRTTVQGLHEGVQEFADLHNIAAEEFNACAAAAETDGTP